MNRPLWISFFQLGLVVIALVLVLVNKPRLRRVRRSFTNELYYPKDVFVIFLIYLLLYFLYFTTIAITAIMYPYEWDTWRTTIFNLVIFITGICGVFYYILLYLQSRHHLAENGLYYRKLFFAGGFVTWADIQYVDYSSWRGVFIIKTKSGQTIRILWILVGAPEFAQAILAHAPQNTIDPETRPILETVANGNPPPPW